MRQGLSFGGFDMGLVKFLSGLMAVSGIERAAVTDGTEGAFLADKRRPVLLSEPAGRGDGDRRGRRCLHLDP
jgi:hypothetical protein